MSHIGTTEGRCRMIMPDLIAEMGRIHPEEVVDGRMADAVTLREQLMKGVLDLAFSGLTPKTPEVIKRELILDEKLYYVISEDLLQRYAPVYLEKDQQEGREADLRDLVSVPVMRSLPHLHCMQILDEVLEEQKICLNCIHVSAHYDLHQQLAVRDYAACFCLGMYLPHLYRLNMETDNKLHVFRIHGLQKTNPVYLLRNRDREPSPACKDFVRLLKETCQEIEKMQDRI